MMIVQANESEKFLCVIYAFTKTLYTSIHVKIDEAEQLHPINFKKLM